MNPRGKGGILYLKLVPCSRPHQFEVYANFPLGKAYPGNARAELIAERDLPVPRLDGVEVVAQPHCHHASVLGWEKDEALLRAAGASVVRVPGCCGLAGDFGMTHYDVSVRVAETALLPAVRAHPNAVVLADGLSCRHQLADLAGVRAKHLAELLASRIGT